MQKTKQKMAKQAKKPSIKDLEKQLKESEKSRDDYLAGWQRAKADLVNYKKDEAKRMTEMADFIWAGLALKILQIVDNLELAKKYLPKKLENDDWAKGILQIETQIKEFLKSEGVEEIATEKFDPVLHEAVEEIVSKDVEQGNIIEVIQKGYKLNGRILRSARVKVSK